MINNGTESSPRKIRCKIIYSDFVSIQSFTDIPDKRTLQFRNQIFNSEKTTSQQNNELSKSSKSFSWHYLTISSNEELTDKLYSEETYKSLIEKYHNTSKLKESSINECVEIVNKFIDNCQPKIVLYLKNNNVLNDNLIFSLNCLFLSINVISKFIEEHQVPMNLDDSYFTQVFAGFVEKISSNPLAERICESILYAMCSLIKTRKLDSEFWIPKLKECLKMDEISEENKLASSVLCVQLVISESETIFKAAEYLLNKIDIDNCQEYFGFTHSEINDARRNALNNLAKLLYIENDHNLFMIHLQKIIDIIVKLKSNQFYINEINDISLIVFDSFKNQYAKMNNNMKKENLSSNTLYDFIENYLKLLVIESHITSKIVEHILSFLRTELFYQPIERNYNLSNILLKLFRNFKSENIKLLSVLAICYTINCDKTSVIELQKYLNEIYENNRDNNCGVSQKQINLAISSLYEFDKHSTINETFWKFNLFFISLFNIC